MTGEQRWAASGVVLVLAGLWCAVALWVVVDAYRHPGDDMTGFYVSLIGVLVLAVDAVWVVLGLVAVRKVGSGQWAWRPVASLTALAACLSALAAGATWSDADALATALLAVQAVALVAYAALLWTPSRPVGPPPESAA